MIRNGCVIPQILSLPKEKNIIRWLPAMLDKEVKIVVQSLAHIMPEDILIHPAHGRKKAAAVENAAEHLLSWAVTWLMSRMSETAFNDKTSGMFFLGQSPPAPLAWRKGLRRGSIPLTIWKCILLCQWKNIWRKRNNSGKMALKSKIDIICQQHN